MTWTRCPHCRAEYPADSPYAAPPFCSPECARLYADRASEGRS